MPFAHQGSSADSRSQRSSASSTASESGSYASLPSHASSEDTCLRPTKRTPKDYGQDKEPPINGLSRTPGKLTMKALRKGSQDGVPLWERSILEASVGSSSSVRSDSPVGALPRGGPLASHPDFPPSEPPPPPPPPRGIHTNHSLLKQTRAPSSVGGYSSNSSSSAPAKGSSPVPQGLLGGRLLYPGAAPPPPYPASLSSAPSYAASSSSGGRQSPANTVSSSSEYSVPSGQKRTPPPAYTPPPLPQSPQPPGGPAPPRPLPLQAWSARQAKSQSPVIMQSVKSTQVQKPVLQTAIAPTAPMAQTPYGFPPSPAPSPAQAFSVASSRPHEPPPYPSQVTPSQCYPVAPTGVAQPPSYALHQHQNGASLPPPPYAALLQGRQEPPAVVPTTEPPSYASSVVALAVQRAAGLGKQPAPVHSNAPSAGGRLAVATTAATTSDLVTTVASICSSQVSALQGIASAGPRKASPVATDTASSASRSESPVSFVSVTSASSPSTQSDSTHDSGRGKTTHQSPIPVRRAWPKEKEEERRASKVRNYSPAAYKFFMEQHVENVLKSHQQRLHRRQQLEAEMAKVGLSEEAQWQIRRMLYQKESNYIRRSRAKMDKSMFCHLKRIGVGAFGEVALVRKKDTDHLYAMKTLSKEDVLKRNQVAHVKAERDILAEADNEWVVKLYYSFQDEENLYFVMDYIPGGDLMSLLIKEGVFQEPLARFYVAELVLALESVHKLGFIHRDIKPDNVLIDHDGHIKLTDFGLCTGFRWTHNSKYYQKNGEHVRQDSMEPDKNWSKECHCPSGTNGGCSSSGGGKPLERRRKKEHQRCLAQSLVGTPNYIAPEVLARHGYGQSCDWWSVGVILYEMLVGQPPFLANSPSETQYKVLNWEKTLQIPKVPELSPEGIDLILKLCCGADKRLGRNGADEIKAHAFFASVCFDGNLRKQPAPYVPKIRYAADTSNFDAVDDLALEKPDPAPTSADSNGRHPEHAFFEFTFRRFFDGSGQPYPVGAGSAGGAAPGQEEGADGRGSPVYV
ncbi:serine/threonine-protein kinase Warts [Ixodes scapularis]|nr:serine/threonine-protein kinase Warts [Ixodes scapularis]XP_029843361.2 serine/threonine-protein kinase Warts [Ixodes scapularis]XP_029843362.2 serine/threonine-protein kinase Warts [Ixodes scapularis]